MNEVIAGALAPIFLYGNPQGVWFATENSIEIPIRPYESSTWDLPPPSVPEVVIFE